MTGRTSTCCFTIGPDGCKLDISAGANASGWKVQRHTSQFDYMLAISFFAEKAGTSVLDLGDIRHFDIAQQLTGMNVQGKGDQAKSLKSDVLSAAFDTSIKGPVDAGAVRQPLLRLATGLSVLPYGFGDRLPNALRSGCRHGSYVRPD